MATQSKVRSNLMEQWYAVIEKKTRKLVSVGTVLADPLPPHLMAIPLPERPTNPVFWNSETLSFDPKPEGWRSSDA